MKGPRGNLFELAIVRLADEGVPVLALARAFKRPSGDLYDLLRDARADGRLLDLPAADWPVSGNRSERVPTTAIKPPMRQIEELVTDLMATIRVTPQEARFLAYLAVVKRVARTSLHEFVALNELADPKLVDIVACKVRKKLRPHGIGFETLWGYGYEMRAVDRQALTRLVQHEQVPA